MPAVQLDYHAEGSAQDLPLDLGVAYKNKEHNNTCLASLAFVFFLVLVDGPQLFMQNAAMIIIRDITIRFI